jgi:hypothetical protein
MADAADILFVLDNIEADTWSGNDIEVRLDAGAIKERVIATFWRKRASEVIELVNTSESGSTRGMDSVYPRMNALAQSWEDKAGLLENPPQESSATRISSFPIKRV